MDFEWDPFKNEINEDKHGVSFARAQYAFGDFRRIISIDKMHSTDKEKRYFCYGKIEGRVLTVRFTYRSGKIRIFGAGFWREGKAEYEKKNKLR